LNDERMQKACVQSAKLEKMDQHWTDLQIMKSLYVRADDSFRPALGEAIRYAEQHWTTLLADLGHDALASVPGYGHTRNKEQPS
jgi:uncharacterized protein YbdZ (MbtH family)